MVSGWRLAHELIGFGCLLFFLWCNAQKDEQRLLRGVSAGVLVWGLNFALIGAWTACATNVLVALRYQVAARGKSVRFFWLFAALHLGVGLALASTGRDALAIAGTLLGTVAVFLCRGRSLRAVFALGSACWLAHNILAASVAGVLMESANVGLHLWRLRGAEVASAPSARAEAEPPLAARELG